MAENIIVDADNKSGWTDEPDMRFSYRHFSKSGKRTAQDLLDKLRKQGSNSVSVR
ncbi:MAG: hypothetical protein WD894_25560 [Pirellulales bacterium]